MPEDTGYVNRLVNMIKRIVRSELPNVSYLGAYEYAIQGVSSGLVDLSPTDTTIGMPALAKVPMRPSLLGEEVEPTVGKLVIVIFINGLPSRPVIVGIVGPNEEVTLEVSGDINFAAGGQPAIGHLVTVEALVLMLANFVPALGTALTALAPPVSVSNSTTLGALFTNTTLTPQLIAGLLTMIQNQAIPPPGVAPPPFLNTSAAFNAAIALALAGKLPDVLGTFPNIGCPAIKGG